MKKYLSLLFLFPMLCISAQPPVMRSVLTTNVPAFGSVGEALFRTATSPYLNWSNVVSGGITTSQSNNIINLASNYTWAVSNYAWTAASGLTNEMTTVSNAVLNASSNYTWAVSNLVVSSTNGMFIEKMLGTGTNTTIYGTASSVPLAVVPVFGTVSNSFEVRDTNGLGKFIIDSNNMVGVGGQPTVGFNVSLTTPVQTSLYGNGLDLPKARIIISSATGQSSGDASVYNTNLTGVVGGSFTFSSGDGGPVTQATNSAVGGKSGPFTIQTGTGSSPTLSGTNGTIKCGDSGSITIKTGDPGPKITTSDKLATQVIGGKSGDMLFSTGQPQVQEGGTNGSGGRSGYIQFQTGGQALVTQVSSATGAYSGNLLFTTGNAGSGGQYGGKAGGAIFTLGNAGKATNGSAGSAGYFYFSAGNAATGMVSGSVGGGFSFIPGALTGTNGGGTLHVGRSNSEPNIYAMFTNTTPWYDTFRIDAHTNQSSFIVASNGNVGIQTNSPIANLHVRAGQTNQYILQADALSSNGVVTVDTNGSMTVRTANGTGSALTVGTNSGAVFSIMGVTNGPSPYLVQIGSPMLAANSGGTNALVFKTNGWMGMSVSSPSSPLDIAYNDNNYAIGVNVQNNNNGSQALAGYTINNCVGVRRGQFLYVGSNYTVSSLANTVLFSSLGNAKIGFQSSSDGAGNADLYFKSGNASNSIYIVGSSQNVGVGNDAPTAAFQVTSRVNAQQFVTIFGATNKPTLSTLDTNGNLVVAGTLTATNGAYVGTQMLTPQPLGLYGSMMFNTTNYGQAFGATYTNIKGMNIWVTNQFTVNTNTGYITNLIAGYYRCGINVSMLGQNGASYEGCMLTNDVDPETIGFYHTHDNPARYRSASGMGIIYLPANTGCSFALKADTAGTIQIRRGSITIGTP